MNTPPKKWIAALLALFSAPLAFLYVDAPRWAVVSLVWGMAVGLTVYFVPGSDANLLFSVISIGGLVGWAVFAYRLARNAIGIRRWYSRWYGLAGMFAVYALGAVVLRVFFYEPFRAPSSSMAATVPIGSNVMVKKWGYGHFSTYGVTFGSRAMSAPLQRGDIIVFDYPRDPKQTYIKRVVGLPGDLIVYQDKHLLVNGVDVRGRQMGEYLEPASLRYYWRYQEKLGAVEHEILLSDAASPWLGEAAYVLPSACGIDHEVIKCAVPAGNYFVLGDNRDNSADSRMWGFVSARAVIGKVVLIVPPRSDF